MVFGNRVLRGILGTKRDEVTGEWRKLDKQFKMYCVLQKVLTVAQLYLQ